MALSACPKLNIAKRTLKKAFLSCISRVVLRLEVPDTSQLSRTPPALGGWARAAAVSTAAIGGVCGGGCFLAIERSRALGRSRGVPRGGRARGAYVARKSAVPFMADVNAINDGGQYAWLGC